MPQLDPAPWFYILAYSWLVFLTILPAKTTTHIFPNNPAPEDPKKPTTQPWAWPWH
uniref:ATP synthase complex subunit 8 n=1 Tax=Lampris guttatus TaxID=81370 RepID=Q94T76_LAMGT|nr:ATP synthase F0 subunit 8 [Lampris guttatus]WNH24398.1 ATP synthase F0 subunit 8 [Lampris guttatus]BAB70096.1 ATPase subunit 8 [Lampris guttatus]